MTPVITAIKEKFNTAPDELWPSKITRFGKHKNLWAYMFEDGTGCVFGDWSTGERHLWQSGRGTANSDKTKTIAELELTERIADILCYWGQAAFAGNGCRYFRDKGVKKPDGLKWHRGAILVPMRTIDGLLVGVLRIFPDGAKRLQPGSNPAGAFFQIGDIIDRVYVVEGLATGATVHSVTNSCTIVAFSRVNLCAVVTAIRQKHPDIEIIVCADDDHDREDKSSSMEAVNDTVKAIGAELGVQVRGLTLQGKTSVMLESDSGISSGTIDSFLNTKSTWDRQSRQLWVVDEYSMVDSRRIGALVERAENENAQVLFLGDKKQLAAIGAGRLGQDLDENKLVKTVHMDESLRQKNEYSKAIDAAMKRGDLREAFDVMGKSGKLIEIPDRHERAAAMAKALVAADSQAREATGGRKGALAMTLTNTERESVIRNVREMQKEQGTIAKEDHTFTTRSPVAIDAVTRKLSASYKPGMIVIPSKQIGELAAGSEARITAIDTVKNTITFTGQDGISETVDARKNSKGLMVYEERETQLSVGERGVFLKSDNTKQGKYNKLKNGVGFTVEDIQGDNLTVKTDFGNVVTIQGNGAYITNGQVSTGHKSQGATEHTGILSISSDDRLATQNMMYVLTTRQTHDLVAFVDDKEKLIEAIRAENKTSSLDEQCNLLKSLTEQMKAVVEKDDNISRENSHIDDLLMNNDRGNTRQRQIVVLDNIFQNIDIKQPEQKPQDSHNQEHQHAHSAQMSL